jgi:nicotinamidase-related amidase
MGPKELPLPPHYDPARVGETWRVPYEERAREAAAWAGRHGIQPASHDPVRIALMLVDLQNTFCVPGFELFVGGRSGMGAVEDNRRLCAFVYRNLHLITQICPTMDTHQAFQIFHSIFLINDRGEHPLPFSLITTEDIVNGTWGLNPEVAHSLGISEEYGKQHLLHYTSSLKAGGKYDLTIWPYHAMLGGIGHALVPAVEEAVFFHSIARYSQPDFQVKGDNSLTENYSVLSPEVVNDAAGVKIADKNVGSSRSFSILTRSSLPDKQRVIALPGPLKISSRRSLPWIGTWLRRSTCWKIAPRPSWSQGLRTIPIRRMLHSESSPRRECTSSARLNPSRDGLGSWTGQPPPQNELLGEA